MKLQDFFSLLKGILAVLLAGVLSLSPLGFPRVPQEKKLALVWADEFDGETLDNTKWEGCYCNATDIYKRRGSYWNTDMATVKDGALHIRTEYYPDGYNGNSEPGWYTCGLDTNGRFAQTRGYFETRCILPKGNGLWAAFWLIPDSMNSRDFGTKENSGEDGAEIDVFESAFFDSKTPRRVSSNIHIDGWGPYHQSANVSKPFVLFNNPYEDYNTYGMEWNESGYTFYINGIKTGHSDFGGASQVAEYLILSVEVGGENAVPGESWAGGPLTPDSETTDFIVDYVRVYQYK